MLQAARSSYGTLRGQNGLDSWTEKLVPQRTPAAALEAQGSFYLAIVMDLFSRKIVGWFAGPTIHRELVLEAVLMGVFCRSNHLEPSISRNLTLLM